MKLGKRTLAFVTAIGFVGLIVIGFQNCGKGFESGKLEVLSKDEDREDNDPPPKETDPTLEIKLESDVDVITNEGQSTLIKFSVTGKAPIKYEWHYVPEGATTDFIVGSGTSAELNLDELKMYESGTYYLIAENNLGSKKSVEVNLVVDSEAKKFVSSDILLGGQGSLKLFRLNLMTGSLDVDNADIPLPSINSRIGWIVFERDQKRLYVASSRGKFSVVDRSDLGVFSFKTSLDFLPRASGIEFFRGSNSYFFAGYSYGDGNASLHKSPLDLSSVAEEQVLSYQLLDRESSLFVPAYTHSVSFDPTRKLLFIANLGTHKVHIYRLDEGLASLAEVGVLTVPFPRIVRYDKRFDKVYLSTESRDRNPTYPNPEPGNPSYIKVYSVEEIEDRIELQEESSHKMGKSGSDVRINHCRGVNSSAQQLPEQPTTHNPQTVFWVGWNPKLAGCSCLM